MFVPGPRSRQWFRALVVMGLNTEDAWDVGGPRSDNAHGCGMLLSRKEDDKNTISPGLGSQHSPVKGPQCSQRPWNRVAPLVRTGQCYPKEAIVGI